MIATIQVLKKVTLALLVENAGREAVSFAFIFGVGSGGLCSFENALHDKSPGQKLTLTVSGNEAHDFFGHLLLPLRQVLGLQVMPKTITLHVEITAIHDADNREVVQSLAKAGSGCGGGGSCGCGC